MQITPHLRMRLFPEERKGYTLLSFPWGLHNRRAEPLFTRGSSTVEVAPDLFFSPPSLNQQQTLLRLDGAPTPSRGQVGSSLCHSTLLQADLMPLGTLN